MKFLIYLLKLIKEDINQTNIINCFDNLFSLITANSYIN